MRTLRLARIAAEAEGLRLSYFTRRTVIRTVLVFVALVFLFGALAFCQVAAWFWLRQWFDRPVAALIIAGTELAFALVLGILAARSSPGRIEAEALALRRRALEDATSCTALSALIPWLLPEAVRLFRRR